MSTYPEWSRGFIDAIERHLRDLGWTSDYISCPTMLLHPVNAEGPEFWLTCSYDDEHSVVWVVEDEYERARQRPVTATGLDDARAVASEADRAMQILWRESLADALATVQAENTELRALRARVRQLADRLFVTPGAIRGALGEQ